jgi:hypothetical protein
MGVVGIDMHPAAAADRCQVDHRHRAVTLDDDRGNFLMEGLPLLEEPGQEVLEFVVPDEAVRSR